jgi:hypothetical protein
MRLVATETGGPMETSESVPTERQTNSPRGRRVEGPNFWLTVFTGLTGLMILLDILFELRLPSSLIYWLNPISWVSNWMELTALIGGFLRGVDEGVMTIASLLGVPVHRQFLLWFVHGLSRWQRPGLVFVLFTVPFLCAMQFTTKRAYERLAQGHHAKGRTDLEARAISKALFVIRASHTADPHALRLKARLMEIQRSSGSGGL